MRIEKLNDNQIRCTLYKHDLIDRELKISELAYGTEKAKGLFRDMMEQAFDEFGFEAEDIPLVIEAVPVSGECIILIVTKVKDPKELDARFSKFSPASEDDYDDDDSHFYENGSFYDTDTEFEIEDDDDDFYSEDDDNDFYSEQKASSHLSFSDFIEKMASEIGKIADADTEDIDIDVSIPFGSSFKDLDAKKTSEKSKSKKNSRADLPKIFSFGSLDDVILLSGIIKNSFEGQSSLYKDSRVGKYFLALTSSSEDFKKVINTVSEFGTPETSTYATEAYFSEHYDVIISGNAVEVLSRL